MQDGFLCTSRLAKASCSISNLGFTVVRNTRCESANACPAGQRTLRGWVSGKTPWGNVIQASPWCRKADCPALQASTFVPNDYLLHSVQRRAPVRHSFGASLRLKQVNRALGTAVRPQHGGPVAPTIAAEAAASGTGPPGSGKIGSREPNVSHLNVHVDVLLRHSAKTILLLRWLSLLSQAGTSARPFAAQVSGSAACSPLAHAPYGRA